MKWTALACLCALFASVSLAQDSAPSTRCADLKDIANVARFRGENEKLPPTRGDKRVVFLGDTTVANWDLAASFPNEPFINRGIAGQTTAQLLLRFHDDVLQLRPRAVVIAGGTADIEAGVSASQTHDNVAMMAQLAKANNIKVIYASLLPVSREAEARIPAERIRELDRWLFAYAKDHGDTYIDLWSQLGDEKYVMKAELSTDGIHPSAAGYKLLVSPVQRALVEVWPKPLGRIAVKGEYRTEE